MRCEVNEHPLGHEVRLYMADVFQSSQVFSTLDEAERDADARRREFARFRVAGLRCDA
jgi:hypothetical protein